LNHLFVAGKGKINMDDKSNDLNLKRKSKMMMNQD